MSREVHPDWDALPHGGYPGDVEDLPALHDGSKLEDNFMEVGVDDYVMTGDDRGDGGELDIETELVEIELLLVETLLKYLVLKTLYLNYY